MIHLTDLMEPEETVGNLWHDLITREARAGETDHAVFFAAMRPSIATLFRALGGAAGVEITPAPLVSTMHRHGRLRRIGTPREMGYCADYDGHRLRLPPQIGCFSTRALNRSAYLWLAALAATTEIPDLPTDPLHADRAQIAEMAAASERAYAACPGLRRAYSELTHAILAVRNRTGLPACEAAIERLILDLLTGQSVAKPCGDGPAPRNYHTYAPVPIWLRLLPATTGAGAAGEEAEPQTASFGIATRKQGRREERDQANRRDSFVVHRFESIMSWAESLNINRMVDDDDANNAAKAADDQDHLTLSQHVRRAATRMRLSLDLSPQDAEHERLSAPLSYPEWNRRTGAYMPNHTRVLERDAASKADYVPDPRLVARVKRQFAPLHPRRVILSRQIDGNDLDLDALVASRTHVASGHEGSDRIWQVSRPMARDLSVAILMDCSRSTEAALGETSVIEVAREALSALAIGIDTAGDRLGIWGFSSLRRDRVFLHRAKTFAEPMSPAVTARIGGLTPSHYTRLGAAIRHVSAQLAEECSARRLLLVLTDGKPNDLDHYEGQHGIEDSRMAVREARALGQAVHGVIVDADGQDWFARIFSRSGFTLMPHPERLPKALPEIYQTLTMET
jgi:nitric oxide reductase NorD protein